MENRFYIKELDSYQKASDLSKERMGTNPNYDLELLPTKQMQEEMWEFLQYRGKNLVAEKFYTERRFYHHLCRMLKEKNNRPESFLDWDKEKWMQQMKIWLLQQGLSLTAPFKNKCGGRGTQRARTLGYIECLIDYLTDLRDADVNEITKDVWKIEKLDIQVKQDLIRPRKTISFTGISQPELKEEIKKAVYFQLRIESLETVKKELTAIRRFSRYLNEHKKNVKSCADFDRTIIEEYLVYMKTEDTGTKRYGFKRTVEILIKSLKVSQEVEDLLVYPIVYNARHSIELSLKIVIKMLWELERKKKISHSVEFIAERKKKLHTHNIEELYKMACENKNIDRRVPAYFENIEDMIQFYYFDEEGDAFKYELNKDDQPHMIKNQISHISIELLETEFKAVMEKFDDLIYFLGSCVDEYSLGTFTKSLSRTDIGEISKKLPVYEEWSTEKFKEVKDQIKQEYQLGSKELTDALNLIKKHRLFSSNIGCERMFGTITEDELKEYASLVKYYCKKNKSKENIVTEGYKLEEVQQNTEILRKYLSSISMETLRTLLCFYEMGNSNLAVEKLEATYKYIVDSAFDEMYIIRKLKQKNTCLRIIVGMKKCGQVTYEKQLQAALEEEKVEL